MRRPEPLPHKPDWQHELQEGTLRLGFPLPAETIPLFETYLAELLRWRGRTNLTGFKTAGAMVKDGFLDSLACLLVLPPGPLRVVDIGSGAGFPGLPLRIVRPELALTLVEANRRRHSFLAHACRALRLRDVRCLHGRAERLAQEPGLRGEFDVAFARAVRRLEGAASLAADYLRSGGVFVAQQRGAWGARPATIAGYVLGAAVPAARGDAEGHAIVTYWRSPGACFT